MRILVIGAGESGAHLAETLCAEGHDLVVVDEDAGALAELEARNDLMTLTGDGANPGTLERAGVDKVDLAVAVTGSDATNLLACIFAHARGAERTVARVSSMEYLTDRSVDLRGLGVDLAVNPYDEYARDLYNLLRMPGAQEVEELLGGRVLVTGMTVHMDSALNGRVLGDFGETEWLEKIRFVALARGEEILTPRGDTLLMVGDQVYFAAEPEDAEDFMEWAHPEHDAFQRVIIAGGGELGLLLARRLEAARTPVVLIEQDEKRADECSQILKRGLVIKGDALDRETLAGIGRTEDMAYVAVTGSDEHNIIGCLLAEKLGARFTAAQVGKAEYIAFVESQRLLDRAVNPHLAMTNAILRFVRGKNVAAATRLAQLPGELIEVELGERHPWAGKRIRELKIPAGAVIVTTLRGDEVRTATGSLDLAAGDRAVVYALPWVREKLDAVLERE